MTYISIKYIYLIEFYDTVCITSYICSAILLGERTTVKLFLVKEEQIRVNYQTKALRYNNNNIIKLYNNDHSRLRRIEYLVGRPMILSDHYL